MWKKIVKELILAQQNMCNDVEKILDKLGFKLDEKQIEEM